MLTEIKKSSQDAFWHSLDSLAGEEESDFVSGNAQRTPVLSTGKDLGKSTVSELSGQKHGTGVVAPDRFANAARLGDKNHTVPTLLHVDAERDVGKCVQRVEPAAHVHRTQNQVKTVGGEVDHRALRSESAKASKANRSGELHMNSILEPPATCTVTVWAVTVDLG